MAASRVLDGASGLTRSGQNFEGKVAKLTRGKRRPQSRDDTPVGGVLERDWFIESKFGAQTPRFFWNAYHQASRHRAIGQPYRPSAVILGKEGEPTLFVARLEDVVAWRDALADVGSGYTLLPHVANILKEAEVVRKILKSHGGI